MFNLHPSLLHKPLNLSPLIPHFPSLHRPPPMAACLHRNPPPLSPDPNTPFTIDPHLKIPKLPRPTFPNHLPPIPISPNPQPIDSPVSDADLWFKLRQEALADVEAEPILSNYYTSSILSHNSINRALANNLAVKLCNSNLPRYALFQIFDELLYENGVEFLRSVARDLTAVKERDMTWISFVHSFLNYKGFLALQSHRIAHKLWNRNRKVLALLIQNRVAGAFAVDIHPGAKIGCGVLLDHGTGIVVGETAVIGNDVSILHNVTLGGTGKDSGDRHPKIGDGVLIGAGSCVLGNVVIGDGAKIGAGSVVLKDVPPWMTAVGNPARVIGGKRKPIQLDEIPGFTMDHISHLSEWSDFVI